MDGLTMQSAFIGELIGTMVLVLLGNGVVANVVLNKSKGQDSGWIVITSGWGFAVAFAVYATGWITGAHLNPAVTIGLWLGGAGFPAKFVGVYIAGQMIGAFIAATLVWITYLPHWAETEDAGAKLACFSTGPAIRNTPANFICEFIGTAALLFGILAIGKSGVGAGLAPLVVGIWIWSVGLSLGGPTGYAINPARDLGPRIAHAVLPIAGKGDSDWGYSWIPVVAPICGGIFGTALFQNVVATLPAMAG